VCFQISKSYILIKYKLALAVLVYLFILIDILEPKIEHYPVSVNFSSKGG